MLLIFPVLLLGYLLLGLIWWATAHPMPGINYTPDVRQQLVIKATISNHGDEGYQLTIRHRYNGKYVY